MEGTGVERVAEDRVDLAGAAGGVAEEGAVVGEDDGGSEGELEAEAAGKLTDRIVGEVVEELGDHSCLEGAAREVVGEAGLAAVGAKVSAQPLAGEFDGAAGSIGGEKAQGLLT